MQLTTVRRALVFAAATAALTVSAPAHADYISDYPAAVAETVVANANAAVANAAASAAFPITCQISEKAGGPIINPGVNTGVGAAVFPQDYASAGAQCFSFQQKNYSISLRILLERRTATGSWIAFDSSPLMTATAVEGVAAIPQAVLRHVYDRIPDPNIGTTGSVHRGKFVLTISTGQAYAAEYAPLPWTMAPW